MAIYTLDAKTFNVINITTHTLVLDNYISEHFLISDMSKRLLVLQNHIANLIDVYNPVLLAYELPFLNTKFPMAVMQLSQYVALLKQTAFMLNPFIKMLEYPPRYIKRMVGAGGNADKNDMKLVVSKITAINKFVNVDKLTEHEIDALAIGYVAIEEITLCPLYLLSH